MSARMQFPLSQRRHTNIAVVRYSKNGVRLEIACYKNKVISYRSGIEDRLDEVLQVERIFSSVARGYVASEKDIETVFGPEMSEVEAIKFMLNHGELQVAQQERVAEVDEMFKDIALIISQKCVNSITNRPFPSQVIEQALRSIGAGVKLDQAVKKQALGLIHQLIDSQIIPIARANMKLRCTTTTAEALQQLKKWCEIHSAEVLQTVEPSAPEQKDFSILLTMQPNLFRDLEKFIKEKLPSGSNLHMIDSAVMEVGEGDAHDISNLAHAGAVAGRDAAAAQSHSRSVEADVLSSEPEDDAAHGGSAKHKGKQLCQSTVPSDIVDNDADEEKSGTNGKKGKKKGKKGGKKGKRGDDDSDDDQPPATANQRGGTGAADEISLQLQKLGLNPGTDLGGDSDDDVGRKGKGKKNKKKKAAAAPEPKKTKNSHNASDSEEGSDEELAVNRRQRKKAGGPAKQTVNVAHNDSEFNDDEYNYEDDE